MDYLIGATAILERGESATITPGFLHARVEETLACSVRAALVDFDGTSPEKVWRLLATIPGSSARVIRTRVTDALVARGECSLTDVFVTLSDAASCDRVDLFAHWLPDEATCRELSERGIEVVCHPLEAIEAAAIVSGQRHSLWKGAAA